MRIFRHGFAAKHGLARDTPRPRHREEKRLKILAAMDAAWMQGITRSSCEPRHPGGVPFAHGAETSTESQRVSASICRLRDRSRLGRAPGRFRTTPPGISAENRGAFDRFQRVKHDVLHGSFGGGQAAGRQDALRFRRRAPDHEALGNRRNHQPGNRPRRGHGRTCIQSPAVPQSGNRCLLGKPTLPARARMTPRMFIVLSGKEILANRNSSRI